MKFKKGQSGNPLGKPRGTISKKNQLSKLLQPHAESLVAKAVELAQQGEPNALRLCLERLIPRAKEEPVQFDISNTDLTHLDSLMQLGAAVIQSVANGELTLGQAQQFTSLLDTQRKTIELANLEARVREVEAILKARKVIL